MFLRPHQRSKDGKEHTYSPPVSMEGQEAVFQSLRSHAAQFGVTIEEKGDP
jgi:hypothetical protein